MTIDLKRGAVAAALAAVLALGRIASARRRALGDGPFLAGRGGQHHGSDRVPRPGFRALDARQPLPPLAGALGADRDREPALVPAGCGGIDAFAGAFSFINSDQLIAFGRAVAQNAAGFAFELALETISPVIAETMAKLRALAQWINNQNMNSCETAQALVGALWSKNDRASASICAAIGTSQGIFSDYAAAKHGCGADGKRNSTLASASGAMADQVPVNVNYAWKAIRASSFLSGDAQLAEFAMAVTGTLIVTSPTSDSRHERPAGKDSRTSCARPAGDRGADGGRRRAAGL